MKNPNVFFENYWWVVFDKSTDGKVIRTVRADQLKSIPCVEMAKHVNWDNHITELVENYRNGQ